MKQIMRTKNRPSETPAAFRRLCVETIWALISFRNEEPAAFRRLCVETNKWVALPKREGTSRLQAAVC